MSASLTLCKEQGRLEYRKKKQENFLDPLSSIKPDTQLVKDQLLNMEVATVLHPAAAGKRQRPLVKRCRLILSLTLLEEFGFIPQEWKDRFKI